jgi:hypothetical protein
VGGDPATPPGSGHIRDRHEFADRAGATDANQTKFELFRHENLRELIL